MKHRIFLITNLLIAFIALFYLLNLNSGQDWGGDFSMYIMNARNIVTGSPYAQTNYIYNIDTANYGPPAYPPVFPLMLAPIIAVWGVNFAALKLVGLFCFVFFLFYFNRNILTEDMPPLIRILFLLSIGLFWAFFREADRIMSDIPFLLLCTIALKRINDVTTATNKKEKIRWLDVCLTAVIVYLAYGTRSLGVFLLPVLVGLDLIKNRKISLSTLAILGLSILLMIFQSILIPQTGGYLDQIPKTPGELLIVFLYSLQYYFQLFVAFFPYGNFIVQDIVFLLMLELALVGFIARVKSEHGISSYEIFFLVYLGALLLWPSYQGFRFLFPILPLYLLFCFEGLQRLVSLIKSPAWLQTALPILLSMVLVFSYIYAYRPLFPRPLSDIEKSTTQDLFNFVRTQTAPNEVIAFFKPRVMALFTDRKSVAVSIPAPGGNTIRRMKELKVDYLIVRENHLLEYQPQAIQLVKEIPGCFRLIHENAEFKMYRLEYDAGSCSFAQSAN